MRKFTAAGQSGFPFRWNVFSFHCTALWKIERQIITPGNTERGIFLRIFVVSIALQRANTLRTEGKTIQEDARGRRDDEEAGGMRRAAAAVAHTPAGFQLGGVRLLQLRPGARLPGNGAPAARLDVRCVAFDMLIRQGKALNAIARTFLDDLDDRRRTEDEARRARVAADAVERDYVQRRQAERRLDDQRIDRDVVARRVTAAGIRLPAHVA